LSETSTEKDLQRLGPDTLLYGLSILLVRGMQIFLIPLYSHVLISSEYGIVETIAIAGALVNLTVALEISQGMARYISDAPDSKTRQAFASTAVGFTFLSYAGFALIVTAFSVPLSEWLFGDQAYSQLLVLAVTAIAANGVFVVVQDMLRWQLRPGSYVIASLGYALGSASIGVWLVAIEKIGVSGVFWGQLAGALIGSVISLIRAGNLLGIIFDVPRLRQMLRYSLPLVFSGIAVFGNMFIDRIVVRDQLGIHALGIYGVAARFASVVSILAVGLQAALTPLVFRHWREPGTDVFLGRICRMYCVAMIPLVGGISLFAPEILAMLTGPEFHTGSKILPLLTLGAMFSTLYVFAPGLFLGEKTHFVAILNAMGASVNLVLALFLTRWLGMIGAAAAASITHAIIFAGYVMLGRRWFEVTYQVRKVGFSLAFIVLLAIIGLLGQSLLTSLVITTLIIKFIVLLLSMFIAYFLGLDSDDRTWLNQQISSFKNILKTAEGKL
jgi:O-antigen/teichoic acid export membrane protein